MPKHRVLWLGLLVCLGVAGFIGFLWLTTPEQPLNREVARIQKGMSTQEVEAILGAFPSERMLLWSGLKPHGIEEARIWRDGRDSVGVDFDLEGRVAYIYILVDARQDSFFDKLRRWLRPAWW